MLTSRFRYRVRRDTVHVQLEDSCETTMWNGIITAFSVFSLPYTFDGSAISTSYFDRLKLMNYSFSAVTYLC